MLKAWAPCLSGCFCFSLFYSKFTIKFISPKANSHLSVGTRQRQCISFSECLCVSLSDWLCECLSLCVACGLWHILLTSAPMCVHTKLNNPRSETVSGIYVSVFVCLWMSDLGWSFLRWLLDWVCLCVFMSVSFYVSNFNWVSPSLCCVWLCESVSEKIWGS